jgi:hypothetical protein
MRAASTAAPPPKPGASAAFSLMNSTTLFKIHKTRSAVMSVLKRARYVISL